MNREPDAADSANGIPVATRRLIHDHLESVERLEILLLLFDARERTWNIREIEERIRSTPDSVQQNVAALVGQHLVAADAAAPGKFKYQPASPELHESVVDLAIAYRMRRVAVIELIYADRHGAARSFSDAFKLGRKP